MKKRGIGISCNTHPAGLKGGGDPSQAQVRLKPDGTFDLLVGAVDIGQGSKTVMRQIVADELGIPLEAITVNNFDTALIVRNGRIESAEKVSARGHEGPLLGDLVADIEEARI